MKTITTLGRDDFRKWLEKNADKEDRVSVVLYKKHTGKTAPSHRELVEEAICFGWIDTTIKKLDQDKYIRNFTKRTKNSSWSHNTLRYAKEMIRQRKMSPMGLKYYREGLKKMPHDAGLPKNPRMPVQLKRALDNDEKAKRNFGKLPASTRKMLYRWILRAKREETKLRRSERIVERARTGGSMMF
jgi:uncharacterized protein YdeI (YjbR/CyaY-like superfamily)